MTKIKYDKLPTPTKKFDVNGFLEYMEKLGEIMLKNDPKRFDDEEPARK